MNQDIQKILISQEELQDRISQLAGEVSRDYAGKDPVFIGVMKGVLVFMGDFLKKVSIPCEFDIMRIASYEGTGSTGNVRLLADITTNIQGRHVVILEDIFDTGRSLEYTVKYLQSLKPESLKIVTLLDKPERRLPWVTVQANYTGFVIPNEFVVGYGMDYNEHYRNLPYIGVLKPEVYN